MTSPSKNIEEVNEDFGLETRATLKLRTPQSSLLTKGMPKSGKEWKKESTK